jgi:heme-degrading monooxygenase HmoA
MFVRMGSFRVAEGKLDELRRIYLGECAAIVRAAPGNLDCCLLESASDEREIAAWTVWQSEQEAQHYDASGAAAAVVGKVRHLFESAPRLESYRVRWEA